jgi:hypothetical protein
MGELATNLAVIAGVIISLGVIWKKGIVPVFQTLKKLDQMYERVDSLPEWCQSVDESLKQLHPNGGKSLKDRVEDTHRMMVAHMADGHDHDNREV